MIQPLQDELLQDRKLFETILGITAPWHIARVELTTDEKRVDLWLEHETTRWHVRSGTEPAGFDHAEERTWRHLDTCQFQTHLHAEIPRVQCPTHGVKQVRVLWAEPCSRFTLPMERLVIDLILQCSTVQGACAIAGISWDEAWGIMQRAVVRGQARKEARPIAYVGVDEKAFRKGHRTTRSCAPWSGPPCCSVRASAHSFPDSSAIILAIDVLSSPGLNGEMIDSPPPTNTRAARWLRRAAVLNLALGVVFVIVFVFFAFRARFTVPYIDDWSWLASLQDHPFTRGLWQPHNEHIIVIPRLLLWMDFWIWGWPGYATLVAALLSHAAIAGVLIFATRGRSRDEALLLSGSVLVVTFLTYELQGAVFPGTVLFPLVAAFSMLAIACLARCADSTNPVPLARWTALSVVSSVMAMLCLTNGLAVPFILAGLSAFLRLPWRVTATFVAVGLLGGFARYVLAGVPASVLVAPVSTIVRFGLAMLAGPTAAISPPLAVVVGACFATGALWSIWRFTRSAPTPVNTLLVGNLAFILAGAAMASLGRAQFDPSVAAESRYTQLATIGWASLLLLSVPHGAINRPLGRVVAILLPIAAVVALPVQVFVGNVWAAKADHLDAAAVALAVGVEDEEWIWRIHPLGRPYIDPVLPQLRARDVEFLRFDVQGKPTPSAATSSRTCDGNAEAIDPRAASTGLRLRARLREQGRRLLIVDRDGRVQGLAKPAPPVQHGRASANDFVWAELDSLVGRTATADEWFGFAQRGAGPPYRAQLVDDTGQLVCTAPVSCCADPPAAPARQELILRGGFPEGWLDAASCTTIGGWAWDEIRPHEALDVRIEISNGQELIVSAGAFRPDLIEHGKGDGRHAFVVGPEQLHLGPGTWHVSASIAATGVPLRGSPKTVVCHE